MSVAVAPGRDELRRRAAVLSHFEIDWLGPLAADDSVIDALLLDDCGRVQGPDGGRHWALQDSVRRVVIRRTSAKELRAAWDAVAMRPEGPQQWAIDRLLIEGAVPDIDKVTPDRIRALDEVSRWLASDTGRAGELQRRLRFREQLAPLEAVASDHFVGREDLMRELDRRITTPAKPVMIHGFGGLGKSAVLAHHLLRSRKRHDARIAYLTFDHSALDPARQETLVNAIAQQVALQLPDDRARSAETVAGRARDRLRTSGRAAEVSSRGLQIVDGFILDLLIELDSLTGDRPFSVAFDTLEEVQRRERSAADGFVSFVEALEQNLRRANVVIAGRAPLFDAGFKHVELQGLERAEAVDLLAHRAGAQSAEDLARVVDAVGTSPLSLNLAGGILQRDGVEEVVRDLELHRVGVEGVLYERLLGHIPDPAVRRLAHPGLTLRRVTPDLIERVLARPCKVTVPDHGRAVELFEGLAHEAMLVEPVPGDPWQVVHRPDVRRMMLPALSREERDVVRQIHRAAIAYYKPATDVKSRAEGMYHRLMLGQQARTLDRYWSYDLAQELAESIDELPPASKAYLAGHADFGIEEEDAREAELVTQRRIVHRRVRNLIADGQARRARAALETYRFETRDRSVLVDDLEVQVLELTGDRAEALALAEKRRALAVDSGDTDAFQTFTHHVARLAERLGETERAAEVLAEALDFVRGLEPTDRRRLDRLRLAVAELGRARRAGENIDEKLATEAIEQFRHLPIRKVRAEPGLLRDLAAEVGSRSVDIVKAALFAVGVAAPTAPEKKQRTRDVFAKAIDGDPGEAADVDEWVADRERGDLGRDVVEALDAAGDDEIDQLTDEVAEAYAAEGDEAIEFEPDEGIEYDPVDFEEGKNGFP